MTRPVRELGKLQAKTALEQNDGHGDRNDGRKKIVNKLSGVDQPIVAEPVGHRTGEKTGQQQQQDRRQFTARRPIGH